ncbi:MAG: hypothetical protein AAFO94_06325 [Bacteroidota bacterium]
MENKPALNVYGREHNNVQIYSQVITVPADGTKSIQLVDMPRLRDKTIIGIFIRKQHETDATMVRKSRFGRNLLNLKSLASAFLTLEDEVGKVMEYVPLEHFATDSFVHAPGLFAQTIMMHGVNEAGSSIEFGDIADVVANEDIEINWIYLDPNRCEPIKSCN